MRYVQVQNPDGSYELIEVDKVTLSTRGPDVFVQVDVAPFKSVVDGSVVTSNRTLREHNKRNNVVHESEFGTAKERENFLARKATERADVYQGTTNTSVGKRLKQERIQHILEAMQKSERR